MKNEVINWLMWYVITTFIVIIISYVTGLVIPECYSYCTFTKGCQDEMYSNLIMIIIIYTLIYLTVYTICLYKNLGGKKW